MLPHCSHITRKRGVFYYRRRLPAPCHGEIAVSLKTKCFRLAEYRAGVLDSEFRRVWTEMQNYPDDLIKAALGEYLREALEADRIRFEATPSGRPVYVRSDLEPHEDPVDIDIDLISSLL